MDTHSFIAFFSGLGLFLFGMMLLEKGIKSLSSESFRLFLRKTTSNPVSALVGGTLTTMVVQSSSMVGLMMMAFVGAGVIPLANGVGVVLGANLGTTFTGWVVTTLGFKLKLSEYAMPLMGLGAFWIVILNNQPRWKAWGNLILGLGLLLFGLDAMKTSMEQVAASFDIQMLQGYPAIVYLLVGVAFTAVIQSSSAAMIITLSALSAGIVDLPSAAALVIGADLGTTSTMALGGIGASAIKKQLALAHVLINVVTAVQAFVLLGFYLSLVEGVLGADDPLYSLVAFHSLFNLIGIVLFLPVVKLFSRFLENRFSDTQWDVRAYINNVPFNMSAESLLAVSKEVERVIVQVSALAFRNLKIEAETLRVTQSTKQLLANAFAKEKQFIDCYDDIKKLEGEILEYAGQVQTLPLEPEKVGLLHRYLNAARHSVYAAKSMKDIRENLAQLRHSENSSLRAFYETQLQEQKTALVALLQLLHGDHEAGYMREQLNVLRSKAQQNQMLIEQKMFSSGLQEGASEEETSTLLNVNRELRAATENLSKAVGFLRLEDELLVD